MKIDLYIGDARTVLARLPESSVDCVMTSPPYWGLRDYGVPGQLGLERDPVRYLARMRGVFRLVWRVLKPEGVLWLNMGDSYYSPRVGGATGSTSTIKGKGSQDAAKDAARARHSRKQGENFGSNMSGASRRRGVRGLKPKDLVGLPWLLALALRADPRCPWFLRCDVIWEKPSPMPESVEDRPTKAHEYVFLLAKSERYYYDAEAIKEPVQADTVARYGRARHGGYEPPGQEEHRGLLAAWGDPRKPVSGWAEGPGAHTALEHAKPSSSSDNLTRKFSKDVGRPGGQLGRSVPWQGDMRNKRSVWRIPPEPFGGDHFATFPTALVRPCVLAGCSEGGVVLDPFAGTGSTAIGAAREHRRALLIELSERYAAIAQKRIVDELGMFQTLEIHRSPRR